MVEELWVSRREQTLAGQKVSVGQIIRPTGARNDHLIFAPEGSPHRGRWAYPYIGTEPVPCSTDGCSALFDSLGSLARHRDLVHKKEWDDREKAKIEEARLAREAEERGDTIGGRAITKVKKGPRGDVPYIEAFGG